VRLPTRTATVKINDGGLSSAPASSRGHSSNVKTPTDRSSTMNNIPNRSTERPATAHRTKRISCQVSGEPRTVANVASATNQA
jgi:hypothetical protein